MQSSQVHEAFSLSWSHLTGAQLDQIVTEGYGLSGSFDRLKSERDETFIFTSADNVRFILKVANPQESQDLLYFQTGAFLHLEQVEPDLPVSKLIRSGSGAASWRFEGVEGARTVRLFSYLDGEPLYKVASSHLQVRRMSGICARLGRGLGSYDAAAPKEQILWDMSGFLDLGERLLHHVDAAQRPLVANCLRMFAEQAPILSSLPRQPIHNDFNPHNILVDASDHDVITGVIDFGDMVIGNIATDVAVALSYLLSRVGDASGILAFLEAYCAIRPLSEAELSVLPVLVRARLAMTILVTEWRASLFPENRDYILRNHGNAVRALHAIDDFLPASLTSLSQPLRKA